MLLKTRYGMKARGVALVSCLTHVALVSHLVSRKRLYCIDHLRLNPSQLISLARFVCDHRYRYNLIL